MTHCESVYMILDGLFAGKLGKKNISVVRDTLCMAVLWPFSAIF